MTQIESGDLSKRFFENVVNALRAVALPTSTQEQLAPPYASKERILTEDLLDELEMTRAFERAGGSAVFDSTVWGELAIIETVLNQIVEIIYSEPKSDDALIDRLWEDVRSKAGVLLSTRKWHGGVDTNRFQFHDGTKWVVPQLDSNQ